MHVLSFLAVALVVVVGACSSRPKVPVGPPPEYEEDPMEQDAGAADTGRLLQPAPR
ncbi:MAG: hypothetical protein WCI05_04985 [Myxococcales bacterium]